ncbi:hypothetical protein ZIOFF_004150 [Zingiber officinale]|uniref:Transposase n=1 Tax=Zingiber officinale TaxID=94328 RepID=A0A8J5LX64_ZINOF|nr:hypothetical protein ZIOFF_004150 [Zingiber officinale]
MTMTPYPFPPEVQLDDEAQSNEYFHSQSSKVGGGILSIPMDDDSPDEGDCDTHFNRGEIPSYNERVMHFMNDIGDENDDDNVVESIINTWVAKCKVVLSDIDSNSGSENYRHGMRGKKAIEIVYGNWESNFTEIPLYIATLEHSNPTTIAKWYHHPSSTENVKVFKYIFWAFGPAIDAFHMCRPVIGVDGTHLRGAYKRKILIAVSKDADNRILLVAYAIVDERL